MLPVLQCWMEGPESRSRRRPTPIGLRLTQGNQLVHPPVAPTALPRPKTTAKRRNIHCTRPHMGLVRFGNVHLPRWPPMNQSSHPVQTYSNPGVELYAVQQAILIGLSLYSEFPPGMALLKTRSCERYVGMSTELRREPRILNQRAGRLS
jgi:hypothetical protein